MRIDLGILVGQKPLAWITKTIQLDFAPTIGMGYDDGTWKDSGGRKIIDVTIECPPDDDPYLSVALEPDNSETLDVSKPIYESHGWKVSA